MRRSERIVRLTRELITHPGQVMSLTDMAVRFDAAKSSLSEDLGIIRGVLERDGEGTLRTQTGAAGGVQYAVGVAAESAGEFARATASRLMDGDRILPGGYLYMTDILAEPEILRMAGRMFARIFAGCGPDLVLTVETKGIPLAVMTAQYLDLPFVIARRDHKWSEGSSVSANYVSGSDRRIQSMSLPRRSLREGARVLVIDDFMKAGGTVKGLIGLAREFSARVIGVGVFMATAEPADKLVSEYISLLALAEVDEAARRIAVAPGNYFAEKTEA